MQLLFSTISPSEELRAQSIYCFQLEELFDLLNSFVAADYQLVSALLIDKGQCIQLPVEAFDGIPISDSIRCVQQEYHRVLSRHE